MFLSTIKSSLSLAIPFLGAAPLINGLALSSMLVLFREAWCGGFFYLSTPQHLFINTEFDSPPCLFFNTPCTAKHTFIHTEY